jgi:hypothetical protein
MIGRSVTQRRITITNEMQIQPLALSEGASKGVYMVKVYDTEKQSVFTQKVVVQ